jgi:hypothetical protein
MKRILFSIIILILFSGIALGYELGAGSGTGYPNEIDTDTNVEVDYPDPLATTARAAVPNDTNAAVIAIETELGINPSGAYDTVRARLDAGDGLYYLKTEIDTKFAALKFTDLADTPANYTGGSLKFVRVNVGETALEYATESDPTVDTDAEIKAILVDEVTKTGAFTAGRIAIINNASGIIEQGTNTNTEVADAVTKKHSQNADTDLDDTFEATFVKKADTVNILSDITSPGADIEDAVTKKHTQNTDTEFNFYNALASDHTYSGEVDSQPVGESVVFGDLLYFNWAKVTGTDIAFVDGGAGEDTITQVAAKFLEIGLVAGDVITVSGSTSNNGNYTIISVVAGTINVVTGSLTAEGAGATVTITSPYEWKKVDADFSYRVPGLRIALETKTNGQTCLMLVKGYIRDDSAFEFAASMVYASVTPGAMSSTAPTEAGDQVQRVGVAKSADILFFNPSIDVGEI